MDQLTPELDEARLRETLRGVIDPELGYNIVDLGLVYVIAIEGGIVDVTMTMTTPGCPAQDYIVSAVEHCLAEAPGVTGVFVTVTWSPAWSAQQMSPAAKAHFRIREDR